MFTVGYNPMRECWQVWNESMCRPANGAEYETEADAIEAMRKLESRVFSRNPLRRDSYVSAVLLAAH